MSGKREESNENEIGKHKEMKEKGMLIDRQETMRKRRKWKREKRERREMIRVREKRERRKRKEEGKQEEIKGREMRIDIKKGGEK